MNRIWYCILILFLTGTGCDLFEPKQQPPFIPPKGMKVSDLQAPFLPEPLLPVEFQVFLYELPVLKLPEFRDLLQTLDQTAVDLQDPSGFTNNSLVAGFGKPQIGVNTVRQLESIGGEQISARSLIVFDDMGDDLISTELPMNSELSWRDRTGFEHHQAVGAGRLSWILKSRPITEVRGVSDVRIEAGFRRKADEIGGRMMGHTNIPVQSFPVVTFSARMSPGDFLLFGPSQNPGSSDSLTAILCRSAPNPKSTVYVFLLICSRVSN